MKEALKPAPGARGKKGSEKGAKGGEKGTQAKGRKQSESGQSAEAEEVAPTDGPPSSLSVVTPLSLQSWPQFHQALVRLH